MSTAAINPKQHTKRLTLVLIVAACMTVLFMALLLASIVVYRSRGNNYTPIENIAPKLEQFYEANKRYPSSLKELDGVVINHSYNYATKNTRGTTTNHYGNTGAVGNEGTVCAYELYEIKTDSFGLNPQTKGLYTSTRC